MTQMKDLCLPVDYSFPARSPLFLEDYNTNTSYFHVLQWLPLTVVPIIYRSIFEHMQNLSYIVVDHGAIYIVFQPPL